MNCFFLLAPVVVECSIHETNQLPNKCNCDTSEDVNDCAKEHYCYLVGSTRVCSDTPYIGKPSN